MGLFGDFVENLKEDRKQNPVLIERQNPWDRRKLIDEDQERVKAADWKRELNEPFRLDGAL